MTPGIAVPRGAGADTAATRRLVRPAIVALGAIGLIIAGIGEWLFYGDLVEYDANPELRVVTDAMVGLSYVGMGLLTWVRRPDSRVGPLLYLAGCLSFTGNLAATPIVGLHHAGIAFQGLWYVVLGIAVMSYPSGRLVGPVVRRFALTAAIWTAVSGVVIVTGLDPSRCQPGSCPPNPFLVSRDEEVRATLDAVVLAGGMLVWAGFASVVVIRWHRASRPARRLLRPLWIAAILLAIGRVGDGIVEMTLGPVAAEAYVTWVGIPLAVGVPLALAYGLVRGRLEQASVGDLVVQLGQGPPDEGLSAAIGRALGDAGATLAFPALDGGLVDVDGRPVMPPHDGQRLTPILRADTAIAFLIHDASLDANPDLVRSVGAATRLALENAALAAEVQGQLAEVQASRARIVAASDSERARIERNLHDGAQQRLVAVTLRLRMLADRTTDPDQADAIVATADELELALAELRALARGIHPTSVEQGGLAGAVDGLAERSPVPIRVAIPDTRWPIGVEVASYFVIAEALANATRHARAGSIAVAVAEVDGVLEVTIADDGIGGAIITSQQGLGGLRDRVAALGGTLRIESPTGGGTTVRAMLPLAAA